MVISGLIKKNMPAPLTTFAAVCQNCGPSTFVYHTGKNDVADILWCHTCQQKQTFQQAHSDWFEEPADLSMASTAEPFAIAS